MMDSLKNAVDLKVFFHDIDDKGNCLADIILPNSDALVNDLKVMPGLGGGIMVHMPTWMHTRWSYSEIQWADVRKAVVERYRKEILPKIVPAPEELAVSDTRILRKEPSFTFHSQKMMTEISVEVVVQGERITGIRVLAQNEGDPIIIIPPILYQTSTYINWGDVKNQTRHALKAEKGAETTNDDIKISFGTPKPMISYVVDVDLPHKKSVLKGFRFNVSDTIRISTPKWMGRWDDSVYTWKALCALMSAAFDRFSKGTNELPHTEDELPQTADLRETDTQIPAKICEDVSAENNVATIDESTDVQSNLPPSTVKSVAKEKNEYGRIKNADNSPIRFYPQTVLRSVEKDSPIDRKRSMVDLVSALSKGSAGGIGQFEINIVDWVDRLRYVTSTMLLDLVRGGFVSFGWRERVTQNKLADIVKRMAQYDLITLTRFVTVDENGEENSIGSSVMRILTLGRAGNALLHELGKNSARYNPFNIYQDGNTVKRYLAANQWLVYLLTAYSEQVGENYETSTVVYRKGSEFLGARVYATVTCNETTMVGEPIRRVEGFEDERQVAWLRHKYERFDNLFSHLDELYIEQEEFTFASRPVLVYICEDDDHMREVYDAISDLIANNPDQEVWFTTDLRIFNYNYRSERFVRFDTEVIHVVGFDEYIGL